jgi:hypothetical protein
VHVASEEVIKSLLLDRRKPSLGGFKGHRTTSLSRDYESDAFFSTLRYLPLLCQEGLIQHDQKDTRLFNGYECNVALP